MDPLAVCVYGADKSPAPSRYDTIREKMLADLNLAELNLAEDNDNWSVNIFKVSGTANLLMKKLASLVS